MPETGKRKASARLLQGLAEDFEQQQRSRGCSAKIVEGLTCHKHCWIVRPMLLSYYRPERQMRHSCASRAYATWAGLVGSFQFGGRTKASWACHKVMCVRACVRALGSSDFKEECVHT
jgi:hypothetical protein